MRDSRVKAPGNMARLTVTTLVLLMLPAGAGVAMAGPQDEPEQIPAAEAAEHVGERVQVCGKVVETSYMPRMRRKPRFLNFGAAWPDQVFGIVVYVESIGNFRRMPDRMYQEETICVTGTVELSAGKPRMVVTTPGAIEIIDPE